MRERRGVQLLVFLAFDFNELVAGVTKRFPLTPPSPQQSVLGRGGRNSGSWPAFAFVRLSQVRSSL